tara:strand:+ start:464 stop:2086 length:1623 start_codon:yes stop_codon:yes gene_type:complete
MALSRNQPSPERQSVLSFVSPSVADLLFYETVDAKTIGAGGGKTVTAISSATQSNTAGSVTDSDYHEVGFLVQVTSASHGYAVGDVVTVENAPAGSNGLSANGTFEIREEDTNTFKYFVRGTGSTSSWTGSAVTAANTVVYKEHPQYGTAHPDTEKFPNHKLCYVKQADGEGLYFEYYYAAERNHQDDYNFEYSQADLGGNKYNTVVRTYVNLRSDFVDPDGNYNAGDLMPDPGNVFRAQNLVEYHDGAGSTTDEELVSTDYILMTRQQKRIGDQELDALFVVEQRVYFLRIDIVSQSLDPATGGMLKTVVKLVHRGENFTTPAGAREAGTTAYEAEANWGLSTAGQNFETQQLSKDWWQVTIQDVIPQGLSDEYNGKVIRSYDTWQNFTWPAVVDGLHFNTANRKDGASQTTVTVRMKEGKDGFSGPTKMTVKQVWKKTKFTSSDSIPDPTVFKTSSAKYSGVQYNVSVSNVLTQAITLIDFIGTKHPTYKMGDYAFPKPWCRASDPTDWPSSAFTGAVSQKPFRGGYLLEVVSVHPPS